MVKNLPANAGTTGDEGLILGSGISSGVGNCSPLWYSCLENHMDRRAWRATVHGVVKKLSASTGDVRDVGLIPGSGRSPGERNGSPLQYSCLENPMDRRAWWATVHGVTKSQTRLK